MVRMLIIADIDDFLWKGGAGSADICISCGDVSDQVIQEAARSYGVSGVFAVKGNHDTNAPFSPGISDLHLRIYECGGLFVGGFAGSWRYKPRGHFLYEQWEVEQMLATFPRVDVLVTHNSPKGIHDQEDGVHEGFDAFNSYIERTSPRLLLHGHQHVNRVTQVGRTRVIGVFGHAVVEV
jgi:uncharacterized protein